MKTPSFTTRLLGNPLAVLFMCGWFLNTVRGYYLHSVGLPGLCFVGCLAAFSAASRRAMRAHKAWLREWNAAGMLPAASMSVGARRRGPFKGAAWLQLVLVLALPFIAVGVHDQLLVRLLGLAWLVCISWLAMALVRKFRKRAVSAASPAEADAAIVAWVPGRAGSSPSRADAIRNLPDYALAAMGLRRGDE